MKENSYKSDLLLLITAAIWGFAFVAQRVGMNYIGPYTYNGIRFAFGAISLIPIMFFKNDKNTKNEKSQKKIYLIYGAIAGVLIFGGSNLQQIGLIKTQAGKAGFITDLYIVIVPLIGIALKKKVAINSWIGAIIAAMGLYFLCVKENFNITNSDLVILASAFVFAVHILFIDHSAQKVNAIKLAFLQYVVCSILSMIAAVLCENINLIQIFNAGIPIIYGGVFSVGIAYTLQIVGQKNAEPTHASIIMSMEAAFAAVGGFILLNEHLSVRAVLGCILMLIGMVVSQVKIFARNS